MSRGRRMKSNAMWLVVYAALVGTLAVAQDAAPKPIYATVTKIDAGAKELVVKADNGGEIGVTLAPKHSLRKIALGETDLRKAATIELTDIAVGDRVMVRGVPSADQKTATATLILVMSSSDVAKKQEEERGDWDKRGVNGIVTAASAESVTL